MVLQSVPSIFRDNAVNGLENRYSRNAFSAGFILVMTREHSGPITQSGHLATTPSSPIQGLVHRGDDVGRCRVELLLVVDPVDQIGIGEQEARVACTEKPLASPTGAVHCRPNANTRHHAGQPAGVPTIKGRARR